MIKNGVTGFANHFSQMDEVARVVEQTGMRAGLSRTMLDKGDNRDCQRQIDEGVAFAERWQGRCSRIQPMLGPHAAYTCSDQLLRRAAESVMEDLVGGEQASAEVARQKQQHDQQSADDVAERQLQE